MLAIILNSIEKITLVYYSVILQFEFHDRPGILIPSRKIFVQQRSWRKHYSVINLFNEK